MLAQRIQNSGGFQKKKYTTTPYFECPPDHWLSSYPNLRKQEPIFVFFQDAEFFYGSLMKSDSVEGFFSTFLIACLFFLAWDQICWPRRLRFLKFCCWFTDPELARMSADSFAKESGDRLRQKSAASLQTCCLWQSVVILAIEPRHAGPWKEPLLN